jgi:hypothetical protein
MDVTLLTPLGAVIAFAAIVPLVALALLRRRGDFVRRSIGLPSPRASLLRVAVASIVLAGVLVGLAAAQPRLEWTSDQRVRDDAEAIVVIDTSRSMLARRTPRAQMRYDRAAEAALRFRAAFGDVPMGIASLTDRVLPHLFPSGNDDVFASTLHRSLGVDRPPPQGSFASTATRLAALESIVTRRFFTPTVRHRLIVVFTDGESVPISGAKMAAAFRRPPGIDTIFIHFWHSDERVFDGGQPEPQYSPDPRSRAILDAAAETLGGRVFAEGDVDEAIGAARKGLGEGPTVVQGQKRNRLALAPYLAGAAFLPLALLLWRRDR